MTDQIVKELRAVTRPSMGRSIPRLEDRKLLLGQGQYLDDIPVANLLHCAFVRSPIAHARIEHIVVEDARPIPGVHAILTLEDLLPMLTSGRMPLGASPTSEQNNSTPFVLSNKEVAYVGEPIALVVAESRYVAEDAASQVQIDFTPLAVVRDARDALSSESPVVRTELKTNLLNSFNVSFGDVAEAFSRAPHAFSDQLWQHRGCGHSMEGRGSPRRSPSRI